ncbi:AprI/Inh family metalloprotease inhibitor [Microvirga sp. CF3062]|uniref:AprI/Inh family metalloprotease inhibitor n=1 Tax=Microvirga sp. CF3062 TaxID=3110182 RepID=UPI002E77F506|nr:AprI/Inh family metalloprotease inhibitor [Microvirga sp. CF3062]MEE1655370.1 AprI/Inh family metalloprotease inhibitor [Microvirga sp. CF3062]
MAERWQLTFMNRKAVSKVALFMVAGAVTACNSTENLYGQGPWGPASTPRSYPAYSAPWGGRPAVPTYGIAVQPFDEPIHMVESPSRFARKGYEAHLEPELPPGPLPSRPGFDVGSAPEPLPAPDPQYPSPAQLGTNDDVQASAPGVFRPPHRPSSYAGMWNARVSSTSCRVQLSSVPSLDLYKASSQGCSNGALKTVNGWSISDNHVILFSRGQVVARLSGAEAALSGTLNGSETALTMTR